MPKSHRASLLRSSRTQRLVRVTRQGLDNRGAFLQGYVVRVGPSLVLLNRVDPAILLDGYSLLRVNDITSVDTTFPSRTFVQRALHVRGLVPRPPTPSFPLGSIVDAVLAAQAQFPLVTIHRERQHRNSCWIGQVVRLTETALILREISPSATWDPEATHRLSSITCVEFGGSYEGALAAVAGAQPNPALQRTRFARR